MTQAPSSDGMTAQVMGTAMGSELRVQASGKVTPPPLSADHGESPPGDTDGCTTAVPAVRTLDTTSPPALQLSYRVPMPLTHIVVEFTRFCEVNTARKRCSGKAVGLIAARCEVCGFIESFTICEACYVSRRWLLCQECDNDNLVFSEPVAI